MAPANDNGTGGARVASRPRSMPGDWNATDPWSDARSSFASNRRSAQGALPPLATRSVVTRAVPLRVPVPVAVVSGISTGLDCPGNVNRAGDSPAVQSKSICLGKGSCALACSRACAAPSALNPVGRKSGGRYASASDQGRFGTVVVNVIASAAGCSSHSLVSITAPDALCSVAFSTMPCAFPTSSQWSARTGESQTGWP